MNPNSLSAPSSDDLGELFPMLARSAFSFLYELGFVEMASSSSLLLLRKNEIDVDIYHGRRSCELGAGVSNKGARFSISEITAVVDPAAAEKYSVRSGRTRNEVENGLNELGDLLRLHGDRALSGDHEFFSLLERQRVHWAENFEGDVLARQIRPKAEEAFRLGDYSKAAELYGRIKNRLSAMEEKKRSLAELRAKRS